VRVLGGDAARPLGTGGPAAGIRTAVLAPDEVLVLYTDGLVEAPDRDLTRGIAELGRTLAELLPGAPSLTDACAGAIRRMTSGASTDDVTLLAARRRPAPDALEIATVARAGEVPRIRREIGSWLAELGVEDDDWSTVQLVASELVTNSVEHAYAGAGGPLTLRMDLDPLGDLLLEVVDGGGWRSPTTSPGNRGRGLHLARSMMDDVDIVAGPSGTRVHACRALRRPATFGTAAPSSRAGRDVPYRSAIARGEPPVLHVQGPVDTTTADRLRSDVLDGSRSGALPLVVDLDDVTMLASAGVRVLHELAGAVALTLRARPGAPARAVVDLTGLHHLVRD
jgi:anti-sigma regulatory factor (Ser/Thr protein kinase)